MYSSILVPTDGSVLSGEALKAAVALAKALGAKVTVLYVTAPLQVYAAEVALIEEPPGPISPRESASARTGSSPRRRPWPGRRACGWKP